MTDLADAKFHEITGIAHSDDEMGQALDFARNFNVSDLENN